MSKDDDFISRTELRRQLRQNYIDAGMEAGMADQIVDAAIHAVDQALSRFMDVIEPVAHPGIRHLAMKLGFQLLVVKGKQGEDLTRETMAELAAVVLAAKTKANAS